MKLDLNTVPNNPGIYIFKTIKNQILYIGKAKDLRKRISQYFSVGSVWKQDMLQKADKLEFIFVNTEEESLLLENNMIKQYKPPYNSLLKGDNSYTYIKITNEDYPQVIFTRYKNNDGAYYIGPKTNKRDLIKLLQFLGSVLKFRQCKSNEFKRGKPCSRYDFGICKGWCVCAAKSKQIPKNFLLDCNKANFEYKKIIELLILFFRGDVKIIQEEIISQINDLVNKEHFEWAAKLRDIYINIEKLTGRQSIEIDKFVDGVSLVIKTIGNYYAFVIMNFHKGKIVDIIRFKYHIDDITLDNLKIIIQDEYEKINFQDSSDGIFGYSKEIGKLSKEYKSNINLMLENSLESYIISTNFESQNLVSELLNFMKSKYNFKNYPYRVECIDISHLSGSRVSGGLSVLLGGVLYGKLYRKYKIQMEEKIYKNDDYLALKELLIRRFQLNKNNDLDENEFPNIMILDGGKGQLGVVKDLYENNEKFRKIYEKVEFVSLGKGKARKRSGKIQGKVESLYYFENGFEINSKELNYDNVDKLLVNLRDEAHRFSNSYRKQQMKSDFKIK
ncbi:MAG: GIY-YIG nuclease family protein [Candidatus Absconditabacteria bacterium]